MIGTIILLLMMQKEHFELYELNCYNYSEYLMMLVYQVPLPMSQSLLLKKNNYFCGLMRKARVSYWWIPKTN